MKSHSPQAEKRRIVYAYFVGVIGTFLILAGLVFLMYYYTRPAPVDQARAAERRKNLAESQASAKDYLEKYAWVDQSKGALRVPIRRGMELVVKEWQNPTAARSNLLTRLEKMAAPPPPTNAEPAVNPYE